MTASIPGLHRPVHESRRGRSLATLPLELVIKILALLPPSAILTCGQVCRSLNAATCSLALWSTVLDVWQQEHPTARLPYETTLSEDEKAQKLRTLLVESERLSQRWRTYGAEPLSVYRARAHVDRLTCMQLVSGRRGRYLVTGAVDGFVRVWNLTNPLPCMQPADAVPEQASYDEESAELRNNAGEMLPSTSAAALELDPTSTRSKAANDRRKKRRQILLSEMDTGGDITSVSAELSTDEKTLVCAVGSYYSSAGCLVYALELDKQPPMLDQRASLDPREWFGTHCVSLRGDLIAIGTYVGHIHIFNWRTGWRATMDNGSRSSTAAVKLLDHAVISVTRAGSIEIFSLPSPGHDLPQISTLPRSAPSISLLDDRQPTEAVTLIEHMPVPHGRLIARETLDGSMRPLLSVSMSDDHQPGIESKSRGRVIMQTIDGHSKMVTHFAFEPAERSVGHPFPYAWPPRVIGRAALPNERVTGGAIGPSGKLAVLMSNLTGGVPPISCVRAITRTAEGKAEHAGTPSTIDMLPLRPIPDVGLPAARHEELTVPSADDPPIARAPTSPEPTTPATPSILRGAAPLVSPGTSPSASSSSFGLPSRTDVSTEICIDEAAGLVCIGTARGNCWIADYARKPAPDAPRRPARKVLSLNPALPR